LPPCYRTSAAYTAYALLLAGFFYGGIKLNSRRLRAANISLQKTINDATLEIRKQKEQIEDKNKDITDSIRYAKRLQTAILKPETALGSYFDDGFILFKPKDIVSGDFYWFEKFGNLSLIAAADCTGHGVPGAFMSIIGCNLLSQTVNEHAITKPAAILNSVNKGLSKVLQQRSEEVSVKDGMDIALCVFNSETMMLEYSGAYNPMWLIREGNLIEFKADKFPVGAFLDNQVRIFTNHEMPVQKGDLVYLFSDGFADQFGGPEGKKFKYKALKKLILDNYQKSASVQKNIFDEVFEEWMGGLEQVDDVLLMGVKI
jgi:serine phosphatase RsbU (regulator of sigma subunit)